MSGMQMVIVDSVVEVLAKNFVLLQTTGQPTTEMIQIAVVEDVVCPGACTCDHMYIKFCCIVLILN